MSEPKAEYRTAAAVEIVRHKCPNPECDNIMGFETPEGYLNVGGAVEDIDVIRGRCSICKTRYKFFSKDYRERKLVESMRRLHQK